MTSTTRSHTEDLLTQIEEYCRSKSAKLAKRADADRQTYRSYLIALPSALAVLIVLVLLLGGDWSWDFHRRALPSGARHFLSSFFGRLGPMAILCLSSIAAAASTILAFRSVGIDWLLSQRLHLFALRANTLSEWQGKCGSRLLLSQSTALADAVLREAPRDSNDSNMLSALSAISRNSPILGASVEDPSPGLTSTGDLKNPTRDPTIHALSSRICDLEVQAAHAAASRAKKYYRSQFCYRLLMIAPSLLAMSLAIQLSATIPLQVTSVSIAFVLACLGAAVAASFDNHSAHTAMKDQVAILNQLAFRAQWLKSILPEVPATIAENQLVSMQHEFQRILPQLTEQPRKAPEQSA